MRASHQVRAVRGFLARLVAVLTVIAGLALLHAPQCTDGMTPVIDMTTAAEHVASDSSHAMAAGTIDASNTNAGVQDRHLGDGARVDDGMTAMPKNVLMSCLALLIVIVGLLAILRRPEMRVVLRLIGSSVSAPRAPPPLPPSLIQLCILRT
ncbi:hypothetical protein REH65_33025 [Saccharopolyspora sp. ID03-671]|uniref:hypothetical protein n=1 Tax=Saccharopolyspora sp. ID03-671 TaxID=3073066 RepID=UPI003251FBF7